MFTKYEIKTYPDNPRINSKNNNYINNEKDTEQITETTFQPKCIFTKQNNNISFYQSSSKNSFKNSKNKDKKSTANITPIMKTKKNIYTINTTQEKSEEKTITPPEHQTEHTTNTEYTIASSYNDNKEKIENTIVKQNPILTTSFKIPKTSIISTTIPTHINLTSITSTDNPG